MIPRTIVPELLDHLPPDHPEAIRSRNDLRRINFLMGNSRWIRRAISRFPDATEKGIVEIGAGDGDLANDLHKRFPRSRVEAYDLVPKSATVADGITWHSGDLLTMPPAESGGVLVANLFLHHFDEADLAILGRWMSGFRVIIACEPDRAKLPLVLSRLLFPFINDVTRHDMVVSIKAGFAKGELPECLGLAGGGWKIEEKSEWRGARQVIAWRA